MFSNIIGYMFSGTLDYITISPLASRLGLIFFNPARMS